MPLPSMEITFAANTNRSERFRRIKRMSQSSMASQTGSWLVVDRWSIVVGRFAAGAFVISAWPLTPSFAARCTILPALWSKRVNAGFPSE